MQVIKVIFKNSKFNYETNANGTQKELNGYFVGEFFNVASYPRETMRQCIKVEILKD